METIIIRPILWCVIKRIIWYDIIWF